MIVFLLKLCLIHLIIEALALHQAIMISLFHHFAMIHHQNPIRITYSG